MNLKFVNRGKIDEFELSDKGSFGTVGLNEDKFTVVLLHFDDSSNILKDECGNSWTNWAYNNSPKDLLLSSDIKKFGRSSIKFTDNHAMKLSGLSVGSDYTIDWWQNRVEQPDSHRECPVGISPSGVTNKAVVLNQWYDNYVQLFNENANNNITYYQVKRNILNSWHHSAFVVNNELGTWYLDGESLCSGIAIQNYIGNNLDIYVGAGGPAHINIWGTSYSVYFNGYIDEFRISNGIARWTDSFIPPTEPYNINTEGNIPYYSDIARV